ncbi:MAG TPA: helix-turn-helix domain-containing protein [Acidimicrobiia bacterium]|nr:helix-turn-helix domain-containing protein [Acidimicrobiia bacterium]
MKGYVARKGNRWYAVIYQGLDPVTGQERRKRHPAGSNRKEAEKLAAQLAAEANGRNDKVRSLTFGAYLTKTWLPGKKINLAKSTWDGYRRKIDRRIIPAFGKTPICRLRAQHLERLYDRMLHPTDGKRALAPKTVLEVHLIIRAALNDAVTRGLVSRNVALVAQAPKLRSIPKVEQKAWNAQQLQMILRVAAGHRLFPAFWLIATTGMRRSELLGLRWDDVDLEKATVSINRGLVAVAYELHELRGKTRNSRRLIDLDPTTVEVLTAWRAWQETEQTAVGIEPTGWSVHRRRRQPGPPTFDLPDLRTHLQPGRSPQDPAPRHPSHPRHAAHQSRRPSQGGSLPSVGDRWVELLQGEVVMGTVPDTNRRSETMPALLTTKAVQQLLNVDRSTIYRMAEAGRLPAIKVGRQWRFHTEAIEQWLRTAAVNPPTLDR